MQYEGVLLCPSLPIYSALSIPKLAFVINWLGADN